jgi:hypothetical protein
MRRALPDLVWPLVYTLFLQRRRSVGSARAGRFTWATAGSVRSWPRCWALFDYLENLPRW